MTDNAPRVLWVAKEDTHIRHFHLPYMQWFQEQGWTVHVACNGEPGIPYCDRQILIPFERNPLSSSNLWALRMMRQLVGTGEYRLIHCHTPSASAVTRWAARRVSKAGSGATRILYTAHGFHFYRGASLINWLLYYPIEKLLTRYTDLLITINQEDHALATRRFTGCNTVYVPGVGVELNKYAGLTVDRAAKRAELGIPDDAWMLLAVGELDGNKNHKQIIAAVARIKNRENIWLVICGRGDRETQLQDLAARNQVNLLLVGYRRDVPEIMAVADVFVFPSLREGLPRALMEAMAAGLPCVVSNIRGNRDLIREGKGGCLVAANDPNRFAEAINILLASQDLRESFGEYNRMRIADFEIDKVLVKMKAIYNEVFV